MCFNFCFSLGDVKEKDSYINLCVIEWLRYSLPKYEKEIST